VLLKKSGPTRYNGKNVACTLPPSLPGFSVAVKVSRLFQGLADDGRNTSTIMNACQSQQCEKWYLIPITFHFSAGTVYFTVNHLGMLKPEDHLDNVLG
jgi:hypothetical protein